MKRLGTIYGACMQVRKENGQQIDVNKAHARRLAKKIRSTGLSDLKVSRKKGSNGKFVLYFSGPKAQLDKMRADEMRDAKRT